ncbi:putative tubulin alpha chain-like [Capsicum annuum]|nr:putative tubulin alpha chain-like [Capsicum annuum]KAF3679422.1 putative tubulin alpha chain-like [Capsicum annuum]
MGVKGKLIGSIEVKCGGHLVHDIFHNYTHHIPNICRDGKEKNLKQVIEAVDSQNKSISWKVIGADLLELYNSFTTIASCDHQWTTWTFVYEKKTEETPEPLVLLGIALDLTKISKAWGVTEGNRIPCT